MQLRRTKGWRMPTNTVKVDRTTLFGNPFAVRDYGHALAVELHRRWISAEPLGPTALVAAIPDLAVRRKEVLEALPALRGKNLACWCAPGSPCHAEALLKHLNR